jgi:hypothetical protein
MGDKKDDGLTVVTPEARLSFPNLFKPTTNFSNQPPKYGASFLIPKGKNAEEDKKILAKLKAAAEKAVKEKWGDKIPKKLAHPFKDGNDSTYEDDDGLDQILDGYEGMHVITAHASADYPPGLLDQSKEKILDPNVLYGGCYVYAALRAFAYEVKNDKGKVMKYGVSFGLQALQKIRDGEPFGNRTNAEDYFEELEGGADDPNSYGNDDMFSTGSSDDSDTGSTDEEDSMFS